jgi:hypothetical protein
MISSVQIAPKHVLPPDVPPSAHDPYTHDSPSSAHPAPSFGASAGQGETGGAAITHSAGPPHGPPRQFEHPTSVFSASTHRDGSAITSQSPDGSDAGHAGSVGGSLKQPGGNVFQPVSMQFVRVRQASTTPASISHTSPTGEHASPSGGGVVGQAEHTASASSTQIPSELQA